MTAVSRGGGPCGKYVLPLVILTARSKVTAARLRQLSFEAAHGPLLHPQVTPILVTPTLHDSITLLIFQVCIVAGTVAVPLPARAGYVHLSFCARTKLDCCTEVAHRVLPRGRKAFSFSTESNITLLFLALANGGHHPNPEP